MKPVSSLLAVPDIERCQFGLKLFNPTLEFGLCLLRRKRMLLSREDFLHKVDSSQLHLNIGIQRLNALSYVHCRRQARKCSACFSYSNHILT